MCCYAFANDHGDAWPPRLDLETLGPYGIDERALMNPRQPHLDPGWIYIPPSTPLDELVDPHRVLILHEAFTTWDGVAAAFADGHVEFIDDQQQLEELLSPMKNVEKGTFYGTFYLSLGDRSISAGLTKPWTL